MTNPRLKAMILGSGLLAAASVIAQHAALADRSRSPAAAAGPAPRGGDELRYYWLNFRVNALGALNAGGNGLSGEVSWSPHLLIHRRFEAGVNLGGSGLGNVLKQSFPVLEYQLTGGIYVYQGIGLEVAAGGQTWGGPCGATAPVFSGNVFSKVRVPWVDRVFAGYSAYLLSFFYTSEVKLGVELRL